MISAIVYPKNDLLSTIVANSSYYSQAASFNYDLLMQVTNATGYEVRAKNTAAVKNGSYAFHTGLSCW